MVPIPWLFVIKMYGFQKEPYHLPKFISPLTFSYEVLRQTLIVIDFDFVSKNKKALFSFPYAIISLIVSHKTIVDIIEKEILSFGLMKDICWKYDPHAIISGLKKQVSISAYIHETRMEIEKVAKISPLPQNSKEETIMQVTTEQNEKEMCRDERTNQVIFPWTIQSKDVEPSQYLVMSHIKVMKRKLDSFQLEEVMSYQTKGRSRYWHRSFQGSNKIVN